MIEFFNVIVAAVTGFILGLTVHSAYLHSKKRGSISKTPWKHEEAEKNEK